jgi:gliding motility-associated-like protein
MKTLITFFLLISSSLSAFSQATTTCQPYFQKYYGAPTGMNDEAIGIKYLNGGGMIVCGETGSYSSVKYDGFLMRLSDDGNPLWTRIMGGGEDDKLVKVIPTSDNGFLALGETRSFNNIRGEIWLVKMDGSGAIQWNKRFYTNNADRHKPVDVIQIQGNDYFVAVNLKDSTSNSDGCIIRLNTAGNILWSKILDSGGQDGINNIAEQNDTLLIAGFATGDKRDAVITKLKIYDGAFISAFRVFNRTGYNDECVSVEVIPDGFAFSEMTDNVSQTGVFFNHYKVSNTGKILYHRRADASTASGRRIESIRSRHTDDGGFIYLANDTTPTGYSYCVKVGPFGTLEWGRSFTTGTPVRTTGMDITGNYGYVFAGYKVYYPIAGNARKIHIVKSDRTGKTGNCNLDLGLDFIDTANNVISSYTWNSIQPVTVNAADNIMTVNNTNFTVLNSCGQVICDTFQNLSAQCATSLIAKYSSELQIRTNDVAKLDDGSYAMAGSYSYYWNNDAVILKTKPNGSVDWTKALGTFTRTATLIKILPSANHSLMVMGTENYTINNGSIDSAVIIKLDYSGNVIWAKRYAWSGSAKFSDMQATDDGGLILSVNINYGSGSGQYTHVIRLNATGDFVWKKDVQALNFVARNVLYDTTSIYLYGNAYINYASEAGITVIKMNALTGDYIWHKYFRITVSQSLYPITLEKIGDSLIAAVNIYTQVTMFQTKRDAGFIKINTINGSVYDAHKITNINHIAAANNGPFNYNWAARSGSDIIFCSPAPAGTDSSLYITRISSSGKAIWSKKYLTLQNYSVSALRHVNDGFIVTGRIPAPNLEWNVFGGIPYLIKTDELGDIGSTGPGTACLNTVYTALTDTFSVMTQPTNVAIADVQEGSFWGYYRYTTYTPMISNLQANGTVLCSAASVCSTLTINGVDSICNTQNVYQFDVIKNAGCNSGIIWQVDTAYANIIASNNNNIQVQFKKQGSTFIKAILNSGCVGLSAQKNLTIPRAANTLNLGNDTSICSSNPITIDAGTGFKTYTWSHTVSSSSAVTVNTKGNYQVTVTDYCNNVFSDNIRIDSAIFPFSAGADTSKCNTDSIQLSVTLGYSNYQWSPAYSIIAGNINTATVFPAVDTSYIITAEPRQGCVVTDTIKVTVKTSPPVTLGKDTAICYVSAIMLNAGTSFNQFLWSNGSTAQQINVSTAGKYSVKATTIEGCSSYGSINIASLALPVVSLNKKPEICYGKVRVLDAGLFSTYLWHDGSAGRTFNASGAGVFYVQVTDNKGCKGSDTTRINTVYPVPKGFLQSSAEICSFGTLDIAPARSFSGYAWNNNATTRSLHITQPGTYWLEVTDENGCNGRDSIIVKLKECLKGIYFPNAFTPNKDGNNDIFKPYVGGILVKYQLQVYNRFGQVIFSSDEANKGWDGTLNGIPQTTGTYVFVCKYQFMNDEASVEKGSLLLIR